MPPPVALALTLCFIAVLFWRDRRAHPELSAALWLPVIWFFLTGSRYVGQWLFLFGISFGPVSQEDGSPLDAAFFLLLIIAGITVLVRRRISVGDLVRNNGWLSFFLLYTALAILWSDFPFVAVKRWVKELGHPVMALIVLTDAGPKDALRAVLRRVSYLLLPPSILTIKYYPQIGRGFDTWSGAATNFGITNSKNDLGYVCALLGMFFCWNLMSAWRIENKQERRREFALTLMCLWMIWWLLSMAHSSTSLVCTLIGVGTMLAVSTRFVSKRFIGTSLVIAIVLVVAANSAFGLYDRIVEEGLGKNASLTDRTGVWQDAIAMATNPLLGAGFESFWLGPRLDAMWAKWWWHPTQAHNGFIETYLNLGLVGLGALIGLIIATFRKARQELLRDLDFGRFRLGVLLAIVVYNYTEAIFKALHPLWTLFYLIAVDVPPNEAPKSAKVPVARSSRTVPSPRQFEVRVRYPPVAARSHRSR